VCPEVFDLGVEKAVVKLDPIPDAYTMKVKEAADVCPVSAIELIM
jgi:ferredoxin